MKTKTVKDIMTPLDEYGTISIEATLTEAGQALEEVQRSTNRTGSGIGFFSYSMQTERS